jgi:hypothetical protein
VKKGSVIFIIVLLVLIAVICEREAAKDRIIYPPGSEITEDMLKRAAKMYSKKLPKMKDENSLWISVDAMENGFMIAAQAVNAEIETLNIELFEKNIQKGLWEWYNSLHHTYIFRKVPLAIVYSDKNMKYIATFVIDKNGINIVIN